METTIKKQRKETHYNKIVNVSDDGEITVLDYIFDHADGFKGATGTHFYPVSKERYFEAIEDENVIEYLMDSGMELNGDDKKYGFAGIVAGMADNEKGEFMFDQSYMSLWKYLREELGLNEDEAYIFECTRGGRCFSPTYEGNYNKKLSALIRKAESK
jgi:hypothetical protein